MVCPSRPSHPGPPRCSEKNPPPASRWQMALPLAHWPGVAHEVSTPASRPGDRSAGGVGGGVHSLLCAPELSFKWQRFVIDTPLWQERNKRAAFAFAQLHSGEVSPVRCSGKQFPHKQIISFTSPPRKRFPSLPPKPHL